MRNLDNVQPEVMPFGSFSGFTIADPASRGARSYETPFEPNADWRPRGTPNVTYWQHHAEVTVVESGLPHIFGPIGAKLGPFLNSTCKYCATDLVYHFEGGMPRNQQWRRADALECRTCRWWLFVRSKVQYTDSALHQYVREATVQAFDYNHAEAPLMELRKLVADGRLDLRTIAPTTLERLVAAVFRDFLGAGVSHVGGPGDGGVDVLVFDDDPPLIIQVKRRSTAPTEGVSVVRDLVGALAFRGWRRGAIVTTAAQFSSDAMETAASPMLQRDGFVVDLYTIDALRDIVASAKPAERPWRNFVPSSYAKP